MRLGSLGMRLGLRLFQIHSSMNTSLTAMNIPSQKPTSVRNQPWYIRLTACLLSTGYIKRCEPILKWRIFGRPGLTRSTQRSTQSDKGRMHVMSFLMEYVPLQDHGLAPRLSHSGMGTWAISQACHCSVTSAQHE